jgi:hypothetical protein
MSGSLPLSVSKHTRWRYDLSVGLYLASWEDGGIISAFEKGAHYVDFFFQLHYITYKYNIGLRDESLYHGNVPIY